MLRTAFADFGASKGSEAGEKNGRERAEGDPGRGQRPDAEVRRLPHEPPRTRGSRRDRARKKANSELLTFVYWWWGGTLRQTYVTQRLRTAANSCGKVRNPAPTANNPTSSARPGSPAKCIRQDASSIPICGIEPASASTHPTFDQAVTNLSRKARRPWS